MAENQDGTEKSEEPTEKRLRESREKGQVARSKELTTTVMLIGAAVSLIMFGDSLVNDLLDMLRNSLSIQRANLFDETFMVLSFKASIAHALISIAPLLAVMAVSAVVGTTALSGWNFSGKALQPKLSKLNPLKGLKKVFGPQGLMELAKAIAKFMILGSLGVFILYRVSDEVLGLGLEPVKQAIAHAGELIVWGFLSVSMGMILIAVVDAPFQVWNHKRQLKMTKKEIKDESKDTDGSPEVKKRIRQTQFDMAMRRMMAEVPEADVVITNPTHFAVAVKYDQSKMRAPIVVAKGADLIASEIRRVALENNVPILSAPPLARAIYFNTDLDAEIPEGLYLAVARVLAYIFHLKRSTTQKYNQDDFKMEDDLPIPDDLKHDDKDIH